MTEDQLRERAAALGASARPTRHPAPPPGRVRPGAERHRGRGRDDRAGRGDLDDPGSGRDDPDRGDGPGGIGARLGHEPDPPRGRCTAGTRPERARDGGRASGCDRCHPRPRCDAEWLHRAEPGTCGDGGAPRRRPRHRVRGPRHRGRRWHRHPRPPHRRRAARPRRHRRRRLRRPRARRLRPRLPHPRRSPAAADARHRRPGVVGHPPAGDGNHGADPRARRPAGPAGPRVGATRPAGGPLVPVRCRRASSAG